MDMNETFRKSNKKEEKTKRVFTLSCTVDKILDSKDPHYNFKGTVASDEMDSELMADILSSLIKKCVPAKNIKQVMNLTAKNLGLVTDDEDDEDDEDNDMPTIKAIRVTQDNKNEFMEFLKKILGE